MKPYGRTGYQTYAERMAEQDLVEQAMRDFNTSPSWWQAFINLATFDRRGADPLDVDYDEDVKQAWRDHVNRDKSKDRLMLRSQAHRQYTVSPEDLARARKEDARMFLGIGFLIGAGFGFIVGVWLALH